MTREQQIIESIRQLHAEGRSAFTPENIQETHERYPERWPSLPHSWAPLVHGVLRTLMSLGLVRSDGRGSYQLTHQPGPIFDVTPSQRPPGNRPPDAPPGNDNGDGENGRGAGYREVLSHATLFALTNDDFGRLLARIGDRS
ncbi:hypothetical protein [Burkholderia pseudomultivorans]|uniref:hypothetical protein n=1 Tax=Burkholderia pseudomultivorans TaxID=1207504 RepID=UPI0015813E0E|nr:hypothetical protein [Burkholderia pseudomultivorans]